MLQQRKYVSNPIVPEGDVETRFGKKIVMENCGIYMDKNKNAGVVCNRITELNINSRKKISNIKSDSSQMKDALNHSDHKPMEVIPAKRPLVSYSTYDDQQKFFETKLVPDTQGKMSICVGRKSGSATVNINIDEYDLEKTYHTWKKIMGKSAPHNKSNLENDRFLTVSEDAERSDKLPVIKNRNPPYANPDGPFENERLNLPKQARDNLDRTLTPRDNCEKAFLLKKKNETHKDSFFLSQPHGEIIPDNVKGVRRTNFPWINSNRIKKILNYHYDDEKEESCKLNNNFENYDTNQSDKKGIFQNNNKNEENIDNENGEMNCNISNNSQYKENDNYNNSTHIHNNFHIPNRNNADCNEQKCNNHYTYENQQNYQNLPKNVNQQHYENYQNCENQPYHNQLNYKCEQGYSDNKNFDSQYIENTSHFGNYDKNLNNSKYNYLINESDCYNKKNDCCKNYYECENSASSNKGGNLYEQNNLYRVPSINDIS